ncbi:Uma2 family endonuclease (plasmid) [Kovacikia minuta CCNUW1]|uniref:Uma2 family endonuclease n=1 Tax=Kovacikia minuta TaxID=2931930 RepID=UPI001CCE21B3|nr:Uma2 family endonuclease [Kovacikia minuta]UBF30286.1 Uma2 family endonuclease [Kovacikia minuta CCNUW1]
MVLLSDLTERLHIDDPEERRIISNVDWLQYEALLFDLGNVSHYRVSYLDGVLEIVSPSRRHEIGKARIGDLLLIYFVETDTEYFPTGSTTFRKQEGQAGTEPDESYCIGTDKAFPDLAIEVVVTSGGINRLELYRRLGVREVWFWQNNQFSIYHLREDAPIQFAQTFGYEAINHSEVLPGLDMNLLAACVRNPNPLAAAKEFRQGVRNNRS